LSEKLGYARSFGGEEKFLPFGVLVTSKPFETLKVGLELAGNAPARDRSAFELNANLGFKWKVTWRAEFHGLVGRTCDLPAQLLPPDSSWSSRCACSAGLCCGVSWPQRRSNRAWKNRS